MRITAALDSIPNGVCVLPPWGGCIGVWINNQRALISDMHADEQYQWHQLSTFRAHIGGPRARRRRRSSARSTVSRFR